MKNQPIFKRLNSYPKSYSQFYSQPASVAVEEDNLIADLVFSLYLFVFIYFFNISSVKKSECCAKSLVIFPLGYSLIHKVIHNVEDRFNNYPIESKVIVFFHLKNEKS